MMLKCVREKGATFHDNVFMAKVDKTKDGEQSPSTVIVSFYTPTGELKDETIGCVKEAYIMDMSGRTVDQLV